MRARWLIGLLTLVLVMGACGNPAQPRSGAAEQLRFTAKTLDGTEFAGMDLSGRPAVLWFWTPWCPICAHEAPFMADMMEKHDATARFVGVAAQGDVAAMRTFVERHGLEEMTTLNDADGTVWGRFGVTAQPALAFISASGTVEMVHGTAAEQEIDRWIDTRARR